MEESDWGDSESDGSVDSQNCVFDYPSSSSSESDDSDSDGSDSEDDNSGLHIFPVRKRPRMFEPPPRPTVSPQCIQWRPSKCGMCECSLMSAFVGGEPASLARVAYIQRCITNRVTLPNPPFGPIAIPQTCCDGQHVVCRDCLQRAWQWRRNWGPALTRCLVCGFGDSDEGKKHLAPWLLHIRGWVQWALDW